MANKVIFSGYLGDDPETRAVGDTSVTSIRIADTERWKDKKGDKQERTTWMTVVFWAKKGEALAKYFNKGDWIYTEGRIQVRTWDDKEGNKRYTTEIKGLEWEFGPKTKSSSGGSGSQGGYGDGDPGPGGMDDDLPFATAAEFYMRPYQPGGSAV